MNKTILLVDDEPYVKRILKVALEKQGYTILSAANGVEALKELDRGHPDVLITDIMMPKMTGRELCETVVERYPDRKFPILVMTSKLEVDEKSWLSKIRDSHFMEKPLSLRRLVARLDQYFQINPGGHDES